MNVPQLTDFLILSVTSLKWLNVELIFCLVYVCTGVFGEPSGKNAVFCLDLNKIYQKPQLSLYVTAGMT
jgi:hypothetical protein